MAYHPDLSTSTPVAAGSYVRAIGWLSADHPYREGEVAESALARLKVFAQRWMDSESALGWPVACGPHECELCEAFLASGNFGVPAGEILYVCPEMIVHYIVEHGYRPPDEFLAALEVCPLPGTGSYARLAARFPILDPAVEPVF